MSLIQLKDIKRHYVMGQETVKALDGVSIAIAKGEYVAITGPSGSGKSTLMNVLGCLDSPTDGEYILDGSDVAKMTENQLASVRNKHIGFVFQSFHLLNRYSADNNIQLPLYFAKKNSEGLDSQQLLEIVGLDQRSSHKPSELSGGQRQRVAIARSLVNQPTLILADEPTGNLDSKTSQDILRLLEELHYNGVTIVLVTHDPEVAKHANRVITVLDGKIVSDTSSEKTNRDIKSQSRLPQWKAHPIKHTGFGGLCKLVTSGLLGTKLRSFLSMLGVIIGVAAVITMIGLGQGASESVTESISTMGTNLLMIRAGAGRKGHVRGGNVQTLTVDDMNTIRSSISGLSFVAPEVSEAAQLKYYRNNTNNAVTGTNQDYIHASNYEIDYGRNFNQADLDSAKKVCIIGAETATTLFEQTPAVGETIKIKGRAFEVIGVLKAKGQGGWMNPDEIALIPYTTAMKKMFGVRHLRAIYVSVTNREIMNDKEKELSNLLLSRHHIINEEEADFHIRNQEELLETMQGVTNTLTLLLAGVAIVSLLVGGIGIMNIMLVSVTERTKEIGLLKALGATRANILGQFLMESLFICFAGGALGVLSGELAASLIESITDWRVSVPLLGYGIAFGFCVFIGTFFGAYPAWRASKLDPIESLRHE
jgi:macrolide transport system ATP-binding/permease protein